jgi:glucose-6-phosphate-specific signal transduction histidine kinase
VFASIPTPLIAKGTNGNSGALIGATDFAFELSFTGALLAGLLSSTMITIASNFLFMFVHPVVMRF